MPNSAEKPTACATLLQLAGGHAAVQTTLQWIEAPPELLALSLVLQSMQRLLPALDEVARSYGQVSREVAAALPFLPDGLREIQKLLSQHATVGAFQKTRPPPRSRLQPFRGVMTSHPIYTLLGSWLWRRALTAQEPEIARAMATVVLFAKVRAVQLTAQGEKLTPIYAACTALHDLIRNHPHILAERQQHGQWLQPAANSVLQDPLDAIRRVIEPVLRQHGLLEPSDEDDVDSAGEAVHLPRRNVTTDRGDQLQIQSVVRLGSTTVRALQRAGLSLAEFEPQEEYVEWIEAGEDDPLDPTPPKPFERSLAEQVLRTRGMIARRERSAQLLAADWGRPTDAEIARLWRAVQNWATDGGTDTLRKEATALLALSLWTAHPDQTDGGGLCVLQVLARADDAPETALPHPLLLIDRWALRFPVLRPVGRPAYHGIDRRLALPCEEFIDLPLPAVLRQVMLALPSIQRLQMTPRKRPIAAFSTASDLLQTQTAALLREHVGESTGRLTYTAVSQWMFRRWVEHRRDHALASLATGRPHLLADTGLHYLRVDSVDLQRWVREEQERAWKDLVRADPALEPSSVAVPLVPALPQETQTGVGAPIVPQPETLHRLVNRLAAALHQARGQPTAEGALLTLHNAYTHYVHALLRFSLGLRDVGQPLPGWDRIEVHHGVVLLSDKDDVAASATRLVPLCPTARKQLQVYARHARATLTRLAPQTLIEPPPVLFYLRRGRSGIERIVRPHRSMQTALEQTTGYTLPRNTNRHWLRSELTRADLPGELIEFFMGHWQRGSEPWGQYSALPAQRAIDTLREVIERLIQQLGFRVLRGWA